MSSLDRILPFLKPIEDLLRDPPPGKTVILLSSKRLIEQASRRSDERSTCEVLIVPRLFPHEHHPRIAPALAAGNPIIVKPMVEKSPHCVIDFTRSRMSTSSGTAWRSR